MCYETSQLAEKIYREAVRLGADPDEIDRLKLKWEQLKAEHSGYYHASGFQHPKLAILQSKENKIELDLSIWGLIPHWVKEEEKAQQIWNRTINARGETIFDKPSFRQAASTGRCILPLDGFFEHHHKNGKAFPYYIKPANKERLLIGAIKDSWTNRATGEIIDSFSIVTTPGNKLLSEIHNNPKLEGPRMPLIINEGDSKQWLTGDQKEAQVLIQANHQLELEAHTVQKLKGKSYLGNCSEVLNKHSYSELNDEPTLFD